MSLFYKLCIKFLLMGLFSKVIRTKISTKIDYYEPQQTLSGNSKRELVYLNLRFEHPELPKWKINLGIELYVALKRL